MMVHTPGGIWIVPVLVLMMVLGLVVPDAVEWLWRRRKPHPHRKRRLPR